MLNDVFAPSEDVVARKIEGETIIIPIVAGIGDLEDDLYTLNETGQAIWEKLDGKQSIQGIIKELSAEYQAPVEEIQEDVVGIVKELARRKIIVGA
ncbi:MAG: PqqD family protein [Desulfobacterales bacterium]